MSGHSRDKIRMVWMPHNNMPFPFDDLKSIRTIQAPKICLAPSKGRLLHACKEVLTFRHTASLTFIRKKTLCDASRMRSALAPGNPIFYIDVHMQSGSITGEMTYV